MKKITRQRKWQLKKMSEGKCPICGKPVVKKRKMCKKHLAMDAKRKSDVGYRKGMLRMDNILKEMKGWTGNKEKWE